jgi:hypothetical protein
MHALAVRGVGQKGPGVVMQAGRQGGMHSDVQQLWLWFVVLGVCKLAQVAGKSLSAADSPPVIP